MRLIAHVAEDGTIQGLVAHSDGSRQAHLTPVQGIQVCEIEEHDLTDALDFDGLSNLLNTHSVDLSPARGNLVRVKKQR